MAISDDARTIAWINASDSQISVASPAGKRLGTIPEGVVEVALSGDGSVAFAITKSERLVRVGVASGTITELIPRTPWITNPAYSNISRGVAAGSIVALTGVTLSELNQFATMPLEGGLGDVRILIGGADVPVEAISPDMVWFQVPWDLSPRDYTFELLSGSSPFETGPVTTTAQLVAPRFFETMNSDGVTTIVKAVHGDWSSLVSTSNPARGGETIHLYMTGLGPVSPPVPTGTASPEMPPSQSTGRLNCQFSDGLMHDATVFFAGLAPGTVGIYQISLQVPTGLREQGYAFGISCGFSSELAAYGQIPVAP